MRISLGMKEGKKEGREGVNEKGGREGGKLKGLLLVIKEDLIISWRKNGNPLQYSCLENSMNRGTWQASAHGVSKSQPQLST